MPASGYTEAFQSDTPIKQFQYCGWIPCLTGHLDFELMIAELRGNHFAKFLSLPLIIKSEHLPDSLANTDSVFDTFNYSHRDHHKRHHRRIALQSWYNWQDEKIDKCGKFRIIVIGESNTALAPDNRVMQGHVLIYPRAFAGNENPILDNANVSVMSHFQTMRDVTAAYTDLQKEMADSDKLLQYQGNMNQEWEALHQLLSNRDPFGTDKTLSNVHRLQFRIESCGMTFLSYLESTTNPLMTDEQRFLVTRQAYYYLKYSLHKHKHHKADSDALTTIIPFDESNAGHIGQTLLLQLKRELVIQKRVLITTHSNYNNTVEAMGIIAYAKSLLSAVSRYKFISQEQAEKENHHLEIFEQSLAANGSAYSQKYLYKEGVAQRARQWTTLFLAYFTFTCILIVNLFPQSRSDRSIDVIVRLTELPSWHLLGYFAGGGCLIYAIVRVQAFFNDTSRPEWVPYLVGKILSWTVTAIVSLTLIVIWFWFAHGFEEITWPLT
ncbi:MAG: hypothetical protein WD071_06620 [Pseudohongiella sp.]|uniref:hypothetical protein n=1 Tax=Pseudohongiella sp. TaxID=1979412 RepID=UPI0034A05F21